MKKSFYILLIIILGGLIFWFYPSLNLKSQPSSTLPEQSQIEEKIYVALENDGKVAVIDSGKRRVLTQVDLSKEQEGMRMVYMPHNVQVAPNGKTVWVTANVMEENHDDKENSSMKQMMDHAAEMLDEVIVIDPVSDRIIKRVPIAVDSHLAHIVITVDNKTAYVTLQEKGEIYKINAETYAIGNKISLGVDSDPHGLRMSPDGLKAYIALVDGKALAALNVADDKVEQISTGDKTVQTAVTPDGKNVFASLYDTKQVARLDPVSGKLSMVQLPSGSKGPVQLYSTPDSKYLYVADQGYYFNQPTSTVVYRIDVEKSIVDQTITAGDAPHGVVVDKRGDFVYVTNLLSNDLSVIEVKTGKEISRIPVGEMPNGISIWNRSLGGTP